MPEPSEESLKCAQELIAAGATILKIGPFASMSPPFSQTVVFDPAAAQEKNKRELATIIDRAILHEREECAKVAEAHKITGSYTVQTGITMDGVDTRTIHGNGMAMAIAEAIRARK